MGVIELSKINFNSESLFFSFIFVIRPEQKHIPIKNTSLRNIMGLAGYRFNLFGRGFRMRGSVSYGHWLSQDNFLILTILRLVFLRRIQLCPSMWCRWKDHGVRLKLDSDLKICDFLYSTAGFCWGSDKYFNYFLFWHFEPLSEQKLWQGYFQPFGMDKNQYKMTRNKTVLTD